MPPSKARKPTSEILKPRSTAKPAVKRVLKAKATVIAYIESDDSDFELSPKKRRAPPAKKIKVAHSPAQDDAMEVGKENIDPSIAVKEKNNIENNIAEDSLPTPRVTPTKRKLDSPKSSSPTPNRIIPNIFAHAHSLLDTSSSRSVGEPLLGREKEELVLNNFLQSHFSHLYQDLGAAEVTSVVDRPSLYISGPPGLGKTALLSSLLLDFSERISLAEQPVTPSKKSKKGKGKEKEVEVRVVMENCSSFGSVGIEVELWERLGKGLGIWNSKSKGKAGFVEALEENPNLKCLIVLDEIDHIVSNSTPTKSSKPKESLLNQLFNLVHSGNHKLTLIGIANALDLTIRSLHLNSLGLEAGNETEGPILVHFEPYKPEDISSIIRQRLSPLYDIESYPHTVTPFTKLSFATPIPTEPLSVADLAKAKRAPIPLLFPIALEFLSKKIAATTGDIRTALALVQHALTALSVTTRTKGSLEHFTATTAPIVKMEGIIKSLKEFNLSAKVITLESKLGALSFNTRITLVGLVIALSRNGGEVRMNSSFEIYKEILKKEGTLIGLTKEEFRSTLDGALEGAGLISISRKSSGKKLMGLETNPIVSIAATIELVDLARALKLVPTDTPSDTPISGVMEETLRLCNNLLEMESRRVEGDKRMKEGLKGNGDEAPMEGFHGNGLGSGNWIGSKRRVGNE